MTFLTLDLTTKKWLLLFLSCLLCWWLFSAQATCLASAAPGRTYTITEEELQALDSRLSRLAQISATQQKESARLQEQLAQSAEQLKMLQARLNTSTAQLQTAQASLQSANQLLQEYGQEERRTRLRIKAQRNTWIALAGCLLVALAVK